VRLKLSLKSQLLLVGATLLVIPWAGKAFLLANERALAAAQTNALIATVKTLAITLAPKLAERAEPPPNQNGMLYVHTLSQRPIIDGYLDDWTSVPAVSYEGGQEAMHLRAARYEGSLYLAVELATPAPQFMLAPSTATEHGDRLELTLKNSEQQRLVVLQPAAPGPMLGLQIAPTREMATRIRGVWRDTTAGHQVEVQMPLETASQGLQIDFVAAREGSVTRLSNRLTEATRLPTIFLQRDDLQRWLELFSAPGHSLTINQTDGRVLAQTLHEPMEPEAKRSFWLLQTLYAAIVPKPPTVTMPSLSGDGRWHRPEIQAALKGNTATQLYSLDNRSYLAVATPVIDSGRIVGSITILQDRAIILSLTDAPFLTLLRWTLGSLLVAITFLVGFALLTRRRITRLTRAVATGNASGLVPVMLDDELAQLGTTFAALQQKQQEHTMFLSNLTRTLSHELRTPIAVVSSSLDNLQTTINVTEQSIFIERARAGLDRLRGILTAMTQANQLEQFVVDAEAKPVNLVQLLNELTDAYAGTFPRHTFRFHCAATEGWARVHPDLIVQALDKIVENAVSYAPEATTITLNLASRGMWWRFTVDNEGSLLEKERIPSLFAPLVSLRRQPVSTNHHLGLGLYLVKLIASHHKGEVFAHNRSDGKGVVFGFTVAPLSKWDDSSDTP
jgi:signal transduction histidine kinase